jgi:hypothetical protein
MAKLLMIRTISPWPEPNAPTERTSIL